MLGIQGERYSPGKHGIHHFLEEPTTGLVCIVTVKALQRIHGDFGDYKGKVTEKGPWGTDVSLLGPEPSQSRPEHRVEISTIPTMGPGSVVN